MLGQEHVVRALEHALGSGRLHHAWLFTGTRGVGKTTLARILAKCLNCERGVSAEPCGECNACLDIDAGRFGDLLEVDAATNTRVEEMRELLDNSQYRPVSGRYKVYIIDEVHMLSRHAFNAMLKTLEEPPDHMKFILATTDPQKVPVTVLSRCLQFALKPMSVEQLEPHLERILAAEQVSFEPAALRLVARAAQGSVRDSLSLLDQAIAFGGGRVEERQVADLLGVAGADAVAGLALALAERSGPRLAATLQALVAQGHSADVMLQDFARLMQQLALARLAPEAAVQDHPALPALLDGLDAHAVQLCWQVALAARRDLVHAPDEPAGLTMAFLRMLTFLSAAPGGPTAVAGSPGGSHAASAAGARPASASAAPAAPAAGPGTPSAAAPIRPAPPARAAAGAQGGPPPGHPAYAGPDGEDAGEGVPAPLLPLPASADQWLALVDRLPAAGVARELARHCTWRGCDGSRVQLALGQAHKVLLTSQERLLALLRPLVGPLQLEITLEAQEAAAPVSGSAASRDDGIRAQRLHEAGQAIAADPVVAVLVGELGGRLVPGSVRPNDEAA